MSTRRHLHLILTTPAAMLRDVDDVTAIRAEDASGGFGVLPGHADFLTVLDASVVIWRRADGGSECCLISGGLLRVEGGGRVSLAAREAIFGQDPGALRSELANRRAALDDDDRQARTAQLALQARAVRQMLLHLRETPREPAP